MVEPEFRKLTPDRYHPGNRPDRILPIEAFVIHYTAATRIQPVLNWLTSRDEVYVSAHFVIDRDGTTYQLVPTDERAIHAGGPTSRLYGRPNVNGRTIGIELMNVGYLVERADGTYLTALGTPYSGLVHTTTRPPLHPVTARPGPSRHWEPYPEAQLVALVDLTRRLFAVFPDVHADVERRLVGHDEVDPGRKWDPGPLFPWSDYRARVLEVR